MANYDDVIRDLYQLLPAYQRIGKQAFKKDLTNIKRLCKILGNPHLKFPAIHIAGTNGKGSVANMLSSIFQEAGYMTGLYTSPHISDFRERIQINGRMIHKNSVIAFTKRMKPAMKKVKPSFFELTVAMAFDHFCRNQVDIAIIETGLGGRLDSTNIIHPELSIITNIGLEHQSMLGNSIKQIAGEKAGIIKENTPVIIGKTQKETHAVFINTAKKLKAPIQFADQKYEITDTSIRGKLRSVKVKNCSNRKTTRIQLDLLADYQLGNTVTVLNALDVINTQGKFKISTAAILRGLKKVTSNNLFKGRWQQIGSNPKVIADGSHNADGLASMLHQLKTEKYSRLHIIYGCVKDKDLDTIIPILPPKAIYYLTRPAIERGRDSSSLERLFKKNQLSIRYASDHPVECFSMAKKEAGKTDLILITGSIFLLSAFL